MVTITCNIDGNNISAYYNNIHAFITYKFKVIEAMIMVYYLFSYISCSRWYWASISSSFVFSNSAFCWAIHTYNHNVFMLSHKHSHWDGHCLIFTNRQTSTNKYCVHNCFKVQFFTQLPVTSLSIQYTVFAVTTAKLFIFWSAGTMLYFHKIQTQNTVSHRLWHCHVYELDWMIPNKSW